MLFGGVSIGATLLGAFLIIARRKALSLLFAHHIETYFRLTAQILGREFRVLDSARAGVRVGYFCMMGNGWVLLSCY